MARIHSAGNPKTYPRLSTSNIQGEHEGTKTDIQKYQNEHKHSIRKSQDQWRPAPDNQNRKIKS